MPTVGAQGSGNNYAVAQNVPVVPAPRPPGRDNNPNNDNGITVRAPSSVHQRTDQPIVLLATAPNPAVPSPAVRNNNETVAVATLLPTELIPQNAVQAAAITANGSLQDQRRQPVDIIGAWISDNFTLGSRRTGQLQNSGVATLLPPVAIGNTSGANASGQTIDLMTSASISASAGNLTDPQSNSTDHTTTPIWVVQIGAPPSPEAAQEMLSDATSKISALGNYRSYVEQFNKTGQTFFRARFTGFAERQQAINMCEEIKQNNISCLAVQS
ncbi:hypothetical protein MNBD_ALPHA11-837 [hydrothermal vent metagenome]|uniref:SPOR domain-containing protein n=1 Tax=hydrothermal vent metagenome TaxID=652676 RepID=A0A3B0UYM8_9ZZZZ